jgi:hypothetical protein
MKKFLMFDLMITPWIIRILYWIMQIGIILGGLYTMGSGASLGFGKGGAIGGLIMLVGGTLVLRLFFEMMMVMFKISENTSKLKELKEKELSLIDKN